MIQIFTVTAPVDGDAAAAVSTLAAAADKLTRLYPGLREAAVEASEGVLTLILRVSARDRWATSRAARKIASNMLLRVKIPASAASMELTKTMPSLKALTKEQGRSVTHWTQRPDPQAE